MIRIVAVLAVLLAAPLAFAEDAPALFAKRCASCHGKDGKGTAVGKKMGVEDLTKIGDSEAEITRVIENGKGKMTPFKGKLSADEIGALAKYVKAGLK